MYTDIILPLWIGETISGRSSIGSKYSFQSKIERKHDNKIARYKVNEEIYINTHTLPRSHT